MNDKLDLAFKAMIFKRINQSCVNSLAKTFAIKKVEDCAMRLGFVLNFGFTLNVFNLFIQTFSDLDFFFWMYWIHRAI